MKINRERRPILYQAVKSLPGIHQIQRCSSWKLKKLTFNQDKTFSPLTNISNLQPQAREKSKWIKLTWEEKMKTAHDEDKLVLLQNLDPEYTSGEVEDIMWHVFQERCTAKMVQQTAISNPHSGQAFVVFGSRDAANRVLQKLDDGCLMLPNQRPLVGCLGVLPKLSGKQTPFVGHLSIDKTRHQMQRETKEAVATSHYSQNNTIEYEMAIDWCLLQSRSEEWWKLLYRQQTKELAKLTCNLKRKRTSIEQSN